MATDHPVIARKLSEHSVLDAADLAAVRALPDTVRRLNRDEDIVRQGDRPNVSAIVLEGMVARYHTLATGQRQYLSLHIAGDWPDAQSLFIDAMDHSVCAVDDAVVSLVPHSAIIALFKQRPSVAMVIWRETLIDAAIFRAAITNNSGRPLLARLAHFFCEQYYRARAAGLGRPGSCRLPLSQTQIGETLGASLPSISRTLRALRRTGTIEFHGGELRMKDWKGLCEIADFNPSYLHVRKPVPL